MITYVFQKYPENFAFELSIILQYFNRENCQQATFVKVSIVFYVYKQKFTDQ